MASQVICEPLPESGKVLPILNKITIFGGLSEDQLLEIFKRLELVHYSAGETIFQVGDSASHIYIVETGRVELYYKVQDSSILKAELTPGTCFGDISVIGIQPHSATTIATENTDLLILSGAALDDIFCHDQVLFSILILNIARESCRRLHKTNQQLVSCLAKNPQISIDDIENY